MDGVRTKGRARRARHRGPTIEAAATRRDAGIGAANVLLGLLALAVVALIAAG